MIKSAGTASPEAHCRNFSSEQTKDLNQCQECRQRCVWRRTGVFLACSWSLAGYIHTCSLRVAGHWLSIYTCSLCVAIVSGWVYIRITCVYLMGRWCPCCIFCIFLFSKKNWLCKFWDSVIKVKCLGHIRNICLNFFHPYICI